VSSREGAATTTTAATATTTTTTEAASSLVVVDGFVYRVSIISYTRQACSAAFTKDAVILSSQLDLTQRCREQWNGDYSYETFWLDHDMQIHKSKTEMGKTHPLVRKTDPNSEKLEWEVYRFADITPLDYIAVREFDNRMAFVSSLIHSVGLLRDKFRLGIDKTLEALHTALLPSSTMNVDLLFNHWASNPDDFASQINEKDLPIPVLYVRECWKIKVKGTKYGTLPPQGGHNPRHTTGGHSWGWTGKDPNEPEEEQDLDLCKAEAQRMKKIVTLAIKGKFDQANELLEDVAGFGKMAKLSFYHAALFLGLGHGDKLKEAAVHAECNPDSKYYKHLVSEYESFNTKKHGNRLISALARSLGVLDYNKHSCCQ